MNKDGKCRIIARTILFLRVCLYGLSKAPRHYSSSLTLHQFLGQKEASPTCVLERLLQPGNHTNIPALHRKLDKNGGKKGLAHDPLFLKKSSTNWENLEEERKSLCVEPGSGAEGAKGIVRLKQIRDHIESKNSEQTSSTKLFCAIYTYSGNVNMTNAVGETWGKRCDGALFASDVSSEKTGHFQIPTFSRNGYGYRGMIQRTRAILAYLYDYFLDDYDFFHICGDDVYMIVENMKEFLELKEVRNWESVLGHFLFAGFWAHWGNMDDGYFYLGGGSGYTLSKRALKAFVEGPLQTCNPYQEGSAEDVWLSDCARLLSNDFIYTGDVEGRQRYHQGPIYDPVRYRIFRKSILHSSSLTRISSAPEESIVSNASILFHKHYHPFELRRMELLLYGNFDEHKINQCYEEIA
jgi:hypothetical protein